MLERMGGGTLSTSVSPSDDQVKPLDTEAVKVEEPEEVTGIEEEEEEEEFIDEGDPVIVPWGATPPPESPAEEVEEEEGNYSEDDVYAEPGKHPRSVKLTCSVNTTRRTNSAREFRNFHSIWPGSIDITCPSELHHHTRTECDRGTPFR